LVYSLVGDDGQILIWDMSPKNFSPRNAGTKGGSRSSDSKRRNVLTDPILSYNVSAGVGNIVWSPVLPSLQIASGIVPGGEWVAAAMGRTVKCLKV
jgi:WD repeat-containing protein 68